MWRELWDRGREGILGHSVREERVVSSGVGQGR